MNFAHYIAHRLYRSPRGSSGSMGITPIIRISILGVALSIAVMLIAVAITVGFKRTVLDYASNITGDVVISRFGSTLNSTSDPIEINSELNALIKETTGVKRVSRQAQTMGLIKTDSTFEGTAVIGIDSSFNRTFYQSLLAQGSLPGFSSQDTMPNPILMSEMLSGKLGLKIGDRVRIYFTDGGVRVRAFTLAAIYKSMDVSVPAVFCNITTVQRLLGWNSDQITRLNVYTEQHSRAEEVAQAMISRLEKSPYFPKGYSLGVSTARDINPTIFSWLDILNTNVYILLGLLALVSGFTMIAGLVILVLDKTRLIGTIKALGANEGMCRSIFVRLAMILAFRGLLWGNLIAIGLALLQKYGQIVRLDRASYYMDYVPIAFSPMAWIVVNVAALALILVMLIGPAHIIERITPARTMRFE